MPLPSAVLVSLIILLFFLDFVTLSILKRQYNDIYVSLGKPPRFIGGIRKWRFLSWTIKGEYLAAGVGGRHAWLLACFQMAMILTIAYALCYLFLMPDEWRTYVSASRGW